jgi:hypothetical protein
MHTANLLRLLVLAMVAVGSATATVLDDHPLVPVVENAKADGSVSRLLRARWRGKKGRRHRSPWHPKGRMLRGSSTSNESFRG